MKIRPYVPLLVLLVLVGLVGLSNINDTMLYSPDSANYVAWARSLSQGDGFRNTLTAEPTRYVTNAPLYPLLIAGPVRLSAEPVHAAKWATMIFGLCLVAALYEIVRRNAGVVAATVAAFLIGLHPLLLLFSTQVLSDIPFALVVVICLLLSADTFNREKSARWEEITLLVLLVGGMFLRDLGLALLVSVCFVMWRKGRWTVAASFAVVAVLVYLLWYLRNQVFVAATEQPEVQNLRLLFSHLLTGENQSMLDEFMARISNNARFYGDLLGGMIFLPQYGIQMYAVVREGDPLYRLVRGSLFWLAPVITIVTGGAFVWALVYLRRKFEGWNLLVLFLLLYCAILAIYPITDLRFLFPIIIVTLIVVLIAVGTVLSAQTANKMRWAVVIGLLVIFSLPNLIWVRNFVQTSIDLSSDRPGQTSSEVPVEYGKEWRKVGTWITGHTREDDVILSRYLDLGLWSGGRKLVGGDPFFSPAIFESLLREYQVRYLVVSRLPKGTRDYHFQMSATPDLAFRKVFAAGLLEVYAVEPARAVAPPDDSTFYGRSFAAIISGDYLKADSTLVALQRRSGADEMTGFYRAVASECRDDFSSAQAMFGEVASGAQAGSFLFQVKVHREAMDFIRDARSSPDTLERAELLISASISYRYLGLKARALELANEACTAAPAAVNPNLFRSLYLLESGRRVQARAALDSLSGALRENASIARVQEILGDLDSSDRMTDSAAIGRLQGRIADCYESIGLYDRAYVHFEAASRGIPGETQYLHRMGSILMRRNHYQPAARIFSRILEQKSNDREAAEALRLSQDHLH